MAKAKTTPKAKMFPDQFDDEEVLFVFRKHPIVMRKGLIIMMFCILFGTIPALIKPEMSYFYGGLAVGFAASAIIFLPFWISWFYSVFIVTDQRLIQITQKGLFNKSVVDLALNQIQSLNYEIKGLQATMLGFGTIMVQTYMGDLVVHEIHHPAEIVKHLSQVLRKEGIEPAEMNQRPKKKEQDEEIFEEN
jgi:uncharacterized membrane protein YdbT with pleckstrin-like domain